MENRFIHSFTSFLDDAGVPYRRQGMLYTFPGSGFSVVLVAAPAEESHAGCVESGPGQTFLPEDRLSEPAAGRCIVSQAVTEEDADRVYLYEDRWWSAPEMVQQRILARLKRFRSVFARKCRVLSGRGNSRLAAQVKEFMNRWHTYGTAQCRYRYVLEYEGEMVAAATFSAARPMVRRPDAPLENVPKEEQEGLELVTVDSYEWVRYASLPGVRVIGGMGRLLQAFVKERRERTPAGTPVEVMTYSDTEWSSGDVYAKLGFALAGERAPVQYFVHKTAHTRNSQRIYRKLLEEGHLPDEFYSICNRGSRKWLATF